MTEMSPAEAIFFAALEKASPAERETYLNEACIDQPELRARVDRLLAAQARTDGFLEPLPATLASGAPVPERDEDATAAVSRQSPVRLIHNAVTKEFVGTVIDGKYTLVEPIGEGGMGSVWRAKQTVPVKRFVAVKLIKAGMDSRQVLVRFDAERQALALMDHPNIAKVLDGGLHDGRPYFVMELVKGVPITEYCDRVRLTPRKRLELFVPVCQAIQHAHQKGVIHRDIKPSNVLIALYDDEPVVKVIDFGVAKAAGCTLTEHTIETGFGGVVGTPQYMSPEQASFNNLDIDTRSDVYALGVLLYELLTGSPPFSKQDLKKRGVMEMLRVVREEEPPRPSTKLSTADALPILSANRNTEPSKLTGMLRNELDWVVMKALEKDRSRRYETANGFAADVQRYLNGDAVLAHPPSTAYRVKKFARRNKVQVIAASLVLFTLIGGIAGTTYGLFRARAARNDEAIQRKIAINERDKAVTAEQQTAIERDKALEAEANARAEAAKSKAINDFLTQDLLTQAEPAKNAAEDKVTLLEVLDRAAEKVGTRFMGQPFVEQSLRKTIAETYHGLASWEKAEQQWRPLLDAAKARDPLSSETYRAQGELAHILFHRGRSAEEFLEMAETAAKGLERTLGPNHEETLRLLNYLVEAYQYAGKFPEAVALSERVRDAAVVHFGPDEPDSLSAQQTVAQTYSNVERLREATALIERVSETQHATLGPDHLETLSGLHELAAVYLAAGRFAEGTKILERVRDGRIEKLGPEHADTLITLNKLAGAYMDIGRLPEAIALFERVRDARIRKLGHDHPSTLTTLHNLAVAYWTAKQLDKSIPLFEEVLKGREAKLGRRHRETRITVANLGFNYKEAGRVQEAIPLLEESHESTKQFPSLLWVDNQLIDAYEKVGRVPEAIALSGRLYEIQVARLGPDHNDTLVILNNLAAAYWRTNQFDKAVPLFEDLLKRREAKFGRQDIETQRVVANLGVNYADSGRLNEAIPLLEEAHHLANTVPSLQWVTDALIVTYSKAGEDAKLADFLLEQLPETRKTLPKDSPNLAGMLAHISMELIKRKEWTEAEPLLRECLAIRELKEPDDWRTFNTKSLLGGALLGQRKYTEAEPLLLAGYEGMRQREATIPEPGKPRLPEALDRLIDLYTATSKAEDVKKWRIDGAKYQDVRTAPTSEKK